MTGRRLARRLRPFCFAVTLTSVGRFDFTSGDQLRADQTPDGLSGITWLGGAKYVAVSDRHAALYPLTIVVSAVSGEVTAVKFDPPVPLQDERGNEIIDPLQGPDREGIAYDSRTNRVWIANERSEGTRSRPSLACHDLATGALIQLISATRKSALAVFQSMDINRGFESVARDPRSGEIWTANETPLNADIDPADSEDAHAVRLVRFDQPMKSAVQYAYVTDAGTGPAAFPPALAGYEGFGISDLLVADDGTLLVLERGLLGIKGGLPEICNRIYAVNCTGATDVSRGAIATGFAGHSFIPVKKTLLIELRFPVISNSNFEGITRGPVLSDGTTSVLLIADNDDGHDQSLYALRMKVDIAAGYRPSFETGNATR